MLLLVILILSYLNLGPLVETVYKGREATNQGIVSFLNKICEMELEKVY